MLIGEYTHNLDPKRRLLGSKLCVYSPISIPLIYTSSHPATILFHSAPLAMWITYGQKHCFSLFEMKEPAKSSDVNRGLNHGLEALPSNFEQSVTDGKNPGREIDELDDVPGGLCPTLIPYFGFRSEHLPSVVHNLFLLKMG